MTKQKERTIEEYIAIAKADIWVYVAVAIIILCVLLAICYFHEIPWYLAVLCDLLFFVGVLGRIEVYFSLKKIYQYLKNEKLLSKLGTIDFWNEKDYFLTENFMIVLLDGKVYVFSYQDIQSLTIQNQYYGRGIQNEYCCISTTEGDFSLLTYSTGIVGNQFFHLDSYLLKKNSNIQVLPSERKS